MTFPEYVAKEVERTGQHKTGLLRELAKKSGTSLLTLQHLERGGLLVRYDKAQDVSAATGGKVSPVELCDRKEAPHKRGK